MKKSGLMRDVSLSAFANVISMLLGMLAVAIIPKFVGVDTYGYYQLYILYTTYAILTEFGFSDGNYLSVGGYDYCELEYRRHNNQFWVLFISQAMFSVLFMLTVSRIVKDHSLLIILLLSAACSIFIHGRYYLYMLMQGTGRIQEYAIVVIIERSISIGLSFVSLIFGYRGYILLIIFDILGRAISMLYAVICCKEIVFCKPSINHEVWVDIFRNVRSGIALTVVTMASTLIISISKAFIEIGWDIETFAKLSLSINFLNLLVRCANAVAIGVFPHAVRLPEANREKAYASISVFIDVISLCALLFYSPIVSILEWWFPQYRDGLQYLIYAVPMCIYECRSAILENAFMKAQRTEKKMFAINVIAIVCGAVVSYTFSCVLKDLRLMMLGLSIVLGLRCIVTSVYLNRVWSIRKQEWTRRIIVAAMLSVFVSLNHMNAMVSVLGYVPLCIIFVLVNRYTLKMGFLYIRHIV